MNPIEIPTILVDYEWLWNLSNVKEEKEPSNY